MKIRFRNTVVFKHPFFGEGPEALKTINMGSTVGKFFGMVKGNVSTQKHQGFVALKFIGVEDASLFRLVFDRFQNISGLGFLQGRGKYFPVSFQHAQNHHFAGGPSAALTFSLAAKIGVIYLNLTGKLSEFRLAFIGDLTSQPLVNAIGRLKVKSQDLGGFISRYFQGKILDNLFYSFGALKRIPSFTPGTVNPIQRICVHTAVVTENAVFSVHLPHLSYQISAKST